MTELLTGNFIALAAVGLAQTDTGKAVLNTMGVKSE